MGETVLVSFNRPPEVVSQRLDTVTLKAGNLDQQLSIKTRETQLGMAVEVTTAPQGPVMKAYSEGAYLMATKRSPSRCVQQGSVDTTTSKGKLILGILGAVAEFETDIRKERQREGIERAKAARVYKGRKPTVDVAQVRSLRDQGLGATDIATKLRIARASVYRALKDDPVTAT